ncbi:hypothetical protein [Streptomyces sp. NPDC001604]|uniref:hypothetical protein n=1 Tax=Streptomyces sp. NPDC001604 TaxID=3364593 RepID=UPI0036770DFF
MRSALPTGGGNDEQRRAFPDDHGGTVPLSAVQGRVMDDYTGVALLGVAAPAGWLDRAHRARTGIAAVAVRKRVVVPPPPPWAVQI